jgi:hypothetical protein
MMLGMSIVSISKMKDCKMTLSIMTPRHVNRQHMHVGTQQNYTQHNDAEHFDLFVTFSTIMLCITTVSISIMTLSETKLMVTTFC